MRDTTQARIPAAQEGPGGKPAPVPPASPTHTRFSFWQALLARRGLIAYLPMIIAVLLLLYEASTTVTDALHYQCYVTAFWRGSGSLSSFPAWQCAYIFQLGVHHNNAPFTVLPLEYPPLTLSIFSLAFLAPAQFYLQAVAVVMGLIALVVYWLVLRFGPRGAGLACAFYLLIGAWDTALGRFDLVPAGLTLLCLIAAERKRWTLAYVALAFGFLYKIYPLLLLPALFVAEQRAYGIFPQASGSLKLQTLAAEFGQALRDIRRWRWKNALICGALIVGVTGIFALINFQAATISQLHYFISRPMQVESSGSTILWVTTLFGHPATIVHNFGSLNVVSNLGKRVSLISEAGFVLGFLLIFLWQWRGKLDLVQSSIAILLVFIITGKVFSPQYLIWLIPLLAYNGSFNLRWLVFWGIISLLTTYIYPYLYELSLIYWHLGRPWNPYMTVFVYVVGARNLLLLLLTLAFIFNWWNLNQRRLPALT